MNRKKLAYSIITFILGVMVLTPISSAQEFGAEFIVEAPNPEVISYQSYAGLSELVTMICDDAINRFQGFYGATVVSVEPFINIGQFKENKMSKLGVTIADQMIAMINNDTIVHSKKAGRYKIEQQLKGVLQEVDGYLRVHISGKNNNGERLSYVANVEMSEPIYRALHSFL